MFKPGESGNPSGRPKGCLNKSTSYRKMLEPYLPDLLDKLLDLAIMGDTKALKILIERMIPVSYGDYIRLEMPKGGIHTISALDEFSAEITSKYACGEITSDQALAAARIIDERRKIVETTTLAQRMTELESKLSQL